MDYKKLNVWKESIELVKQIYLVTANFPKEEKYGLISQLRRASVSIPSNIAEGNSRSSDRDYKRFVEIAYGSALELETQLIISVELKFIDENNEIFSQLEQVKKLLSGFIKYLKK
ncbi:four helix bundle protein [Psychroflexus salarius]|uniref:Four helix bundle protein n=1 Tax=Psychroflexus salarius TaxID=1155689 RepID=A0A1M4X3C0_9FLAO|nr:four helix bundle protein [Psychroflexus salarius]SHE88004.1 four helix bundle protein [Psychroflexus salarius]